MRLKPGVDVSAIKPEIMIAIMVINSVCHEHGVDCVVTSVRDGKHGPKSLHRFGYAADIRTRGIAQKAQFASDVKNRLSNDYDVVLEKDHLHVEYDPEINY